MTQTRFTTFGDTRGHPDLAGQISTTLQRVAPTLKEGNGLPATAEIRRCIPAAAPTSGTALDPAGRMDRINAMVLCLLFELTQQAARFGSGIAPWGQLELHDVDDFAPFIAGGSA